MKTLKVISTAFLFMICVVSFGQAKKNVYFVQTTHTPDQCVQNLSAFKDKGSAFLDKFEFGCMSGDHTAYAFLEGTSEADVKAMLPKDAQATAKVQKVDKFTADQIEKIHKDHMKSDTKK